MKVITFEINCVNNGKRTNGVEGSRWQQFNYVSICLVSNLKLIQDVILSDVNGSYLLTHWESPMC